MTRANDRVPIALALAVATAAAIAGQARPAARPLPKGAFAQNVEYVGFTNVNGHFPFKIVLKYTGPKPGPALPVHTSRPD